MEREIKLNHIYRHFKGGLYLTINIATHSETGEKLVIYRHLYGDCELFARPISMFASKVDKDKYPKVKQKYRFEEVTLEKGEIK